jgi:hypothetical protein
MTSAKDKFVNCGFEIAMETRLKRILSYVQYSKT